MTFDFKDGDVVHYTASQHHCREGMAIAEERETGTPLFDTFWSSIGDRHLLTWDELETAEVFFNFGDFERVDHNARHTWADYHPDDRRYVSHQHGLQRDFYIRKGAKPDHGTKVANAAALVAEAEAELRVAQNHVQWRKDDLARLQAEAVSQ